MNEEANNLSPAGQRRIEAIGRMALDAARSHRRRQHALRAAGGMVVAAAVIGLWNLSRSNVPLTPQKQLVFHPTPPPSGPATMKSFTISRIETDYAILARMSIHIDKPNWQTLGEDELLRDLETVGRPSGLAQVDGKTFLMPYHGT